MDKILEILNYHLFKIGEYSVTAANIFILIGIFVVTKIVLRILKKIIYKKLSSFDEGRSHSLFLITKYFVIVLAIIVALQSIGINLSILIAGSAALFVGLGFGLQNIFNDFISGIIILIEGTIKVGDIVEVDDTVGKVLEIKLRTTKIMTREDIIIIVPNNKFITENVINWSHDNIKTRFEVSVGVAYGSDVRLVEKCLLEVVNSYEKINQDPEARVMFKDFGNSSLDFGVFFWSEDVFVIRKIQSDIRFKIDAIFRENNIEIPFPQRDLHIKTSNVKFPS